MELRGQVALVTGGAVRIGRRIVEALAAEGATVVFQYHRSRPAARQLIRQLRARGSRAFALEAELTGHFAAQELVRRARRAAGRLDILINNAGLFHKHTLRTLTAAALVEEFSINLFAPLLLMRAFARVCRAGAVVNLLDRRITGLDYTCLPYVLTKKALAEATRMAALELAPRIRVNAVAPGAILPPPGKGRNYLKDKAGPVPLRRPCTPEEVANAVLFLLNNDAFTGQILFVDGGQHLLGPVNGEYWKGS